jgi:hypothetical protein
LLKAINCALAVSNGKPSAFFNQRCYQFWILDFGFWIEKSLARGTFGVAISSQAKAKR